MLMGARLSQNMAGLVTTTKSSSRALVIQITFFRSEYKRHLFISHIEVTTDFGFEEHQQFVEWVG
jgi:hypothetical protein